MPSTASLPTGNLEWLDSENPDWDRLVMQCREWHPFYLRDFNRAEAVSRKANATLFVFHHDEGLAVYPVLVFPLKYDGRIVFDLCGQPYAGPVSSAGNPHSHARLVGGLRAAIAEMAPSQRWVTDFCRLNPFTASPEQSSGSVSNHVYVDLTRGYDRIWNEYAAAARKNTRRANTGVSELRPITSESECALFARLYQRRMEELNAPPRYRFDETYFQALYRDFGDHCLFLGAFLDGGMIGSSLNLRGNGYIFSYLLAVDPAHQRLRLSHGLNDLAVRIGVDKGDKMYVLGGGVRGQDGVYAYKKTFSAKEFSQVNLQIVLDRKPYSELCLKYSPQKRDNSFFPPYREQQNASSCHAKK